MKQALDVLPLCAEYTCTTSINLNLTKADDNN